MAQETKAISLTARALVPSDPAELFRSRAEWREEMHHADQEKIGDGTLAKMLRIALSDPDEELWRYAISVAGHRVTGEQIARLSADFAANPHVG